MADNKFRKEMLFSVILIFMYFISVNLSNQLSRAVNIPNSINALAVTVFFIGIIAYLKSKNLLSYYGIKSLRELDFKNLLFCIPMIIVVSVNLRYGINIDNSWEQAILITIKMLGIGFAEEMLFRSFLMKAIMNKSTTAAVAVSSTVFGIIHIFNLLYGADTVITIAQVIYAAALGFMFSVFFYRTGNIIPCVLCHSLLNMTNIFLPAELSLGQLCVGWGFIVIPSLLYALYLYKTKKPLLKY